MHLSTFTLSVFTAACKKTSCAGGRHNMPPPLKVDNIFVFIRQVAGLFRHVGYLRHQQQVDL